MPPALAAIIPAVVTAAGAGISAATAPKPRTQELDIAEVGAGDLDKSVGQRPLGELGANLSEGRPGGIRNRVNELAQQFDQLRARNRGSSQPRF